MTEAQEFILQNYKEPNNFGVPSWHTSNQAKVDNLTCGDSITIYIKFNEDKVEDIAFTGEGCSIAIATASILTEYFKNKIKSDISNFTEQNLFDMLGIELTTSRKNCALLSLDALKKSI